MTDTRRDSVLLQRAARGDNEAFNDLVHKHRDWAYRVAYRLCRCHDEAEDITAEAFIRAHRSLGSFAGNSALTTWLYRIVVNCFLDRSRTRPYRLVSIEGSGGDDGTEMQLPSTSDSPYTEAERDARWQRLMGAIQALPEAQRAMIVLFHGEDLPYEEIAKVMAIPVGTVKSRLNRARLSLVRNLSEEGELFSML